jgi:predicted dinucleotide-binding enzyme
MRIAILGRGNVGGGLARLWEKTGHEVEAFGRDGGDASRADVVVVAVPSGSIGEAFGKVSGFEKKPAIDATNAYHGRDESFPSLAHQVKSITGGPVAKSFNLNFANAYDDIGSAERMPANLWCGDAEARAVTEQLIRDAGFEPVACGDLENARALEDFVTPYMAAAQEAGASLFYRFVSAAEL